MKSNLKHMHWFPHSADLRNDRRMKRAMKDLPVLKLLCSKIQSAFRYFEKVTLENIGAFLLNASKIGIFTEWDLVKSALAFSINLNVPKTGIILIYQIEKPNAKMQKSSKNLVVRYETHSKYFV